MFLFLEEKLLQHKSHYLTVVKNLAKANICQNRVVKNNLIKFSLPIF